MRLVIAGVAVAALVFAAAAPAAEKEEVPRCHGRRATIVHQHVKTRVLCEPRQQVRERASYAADRAVLERTTVDRYAKHCPAPRLCVDSTTW